MRGDDRGLLAGGLGNDLLDVLVAALGGLPVRVAEWARLECQVELIEQLLVGIVCGRRCRSHGSVLVEEVGSCAVSRPG